jgi:hypothetical protein
MWNKLLEAETSSKLQSALDAIEALTPASHSRWVVRAKCAARATFRRTKTAQQLSVALAFGGGGGGAGAARSKASSSHSASASSSAPSSSSSDAATAGSGSGSGSGVTAINVLVSNGHLLATLAKLMLFGLHSFFPVENVYSSAPDLDITTGTTAKPPSSAASADSKSAAANGTASKEAVFGLIYQRFGSAADYMVIGDSSEEETACKRVLPSNTRFWKVRSASDLEALTKALSS